MAAKKESTGKGTKKAKAGGRAKKPAARKPAAKKPTAKKAAAKKSAGKKRAGSSKRASSSGQAAGLDKSVEQFRESLERSVTLSRDRLQDVVDDAVKRGRMTRGDAEKMVSDMVKRGRPRVVRPRCPPPAAGALLRDGERAARPARAPWRRGRAIHRARRCAVG